MLLCRHEAAVALNASSALTHNQTAKQPATHLSAAHKLLLQRRTHYTWTQKTDTMKCSKALMWYGVPEFCASTADVSCTPQWEPTSGVSVKHQSQSWQANQTLDKSACQPRVCTHNHPCQPAPLPTLLHCVGLDCLDLS